ncbi:MAG: hypothetical protein ACOX8T_10615 [Bacillota bacterium]|mgnify:CR=1 FL=1|jgi:hypothetical protein
MSSQKKMRKTAKRRHWGRDGRWLKGTTKVKGIAFYTTTERREFKAVAVDEMRKEVTK